MSRGWTLAHNKPSLEDSRAHDGLRQLYANGEQDIQVFLVNGQVFRRSVCFQTKASKRGSAAGAAGPAMFAGFEDARA